MVFGFGKKKKDENKDIKEAVSGKAIPTMKVGGIPQEISDIEYKEPVPSTEEIKSRLSEDLHMVEPLPEKAKFAPLFVKVDKYRDILESINRMKMVIVNIQSLNQVQNDIKRLKNQVDAEMEKEIKQFNDILQILDKELVRPKVVEPYVMPRPAETAKMQGYVSELEGELTKLQDQLNKIEQ